MTFTPDYLKVPSLQGYVYGTLDYDTNSSTFLISGDRLVLEFVKRLFPGSFRETKGVMGIKDSRKAVQDINWLLLRFPLDIKCMSKLNESRADAIERINRRHYQGDLVPTTPPGEFLGKLMEYQSAAVTFINNNKRVLLADSAGLGKTWSSLAAASQAGEYPVLVVCQTHVQRQWQRAIGSLMEVGEYQLQIGLDPYTMAAEKGEQIAPILSTRTPYDIPNTPFTIIHYGLLQDWKEPLMDQGYKFLIFDEVQELRHTGTRKYSAASLLSSDAEYVCGCSVGGDSVVAMHGGPFGKGWVGSIGDAAGIVQGELGTLNASEIDTSEMEIYSRGWEERFQWKRVNKIFKHTASSGVRQLHVGGGKLLVTDDHSVFVARENGLECLRSDEINIGDKMLVDDGNGWMDQDREDLDSINRHDIESTHNEWQKYAKNLFCGQEEIQHTFEWTKGISIESMVHNVITGIDAPEYVYDFQMEGHPSFCANGVLVHNSATPVFGYGAEIWNVMNIIDFNCLGSFEAFTREWCVGYGEKIVEEPRALNDLLIRDGLMLRRTYKDKEVTVSVPTIDRKIIDMDYDSEVYDELIKTARTKAGKYSSASFTAKGQMARDIERDTRKATGVSKAPYAAEFVRSLIEAGEKPVVYAWHHDVHDILKEELKEFKPGIVTGKESPKKKDEEIRRFMNGGTDVCIISLRSAAGIDGLQYRGTCVVFVELDWSPAIFTQCEHRLARIGADELVKSLPSYYCVSNAGFDEIMQDILGIKISQFVGLMGDEPDTMEEQREAEQRAVDRVKRLIEKLKEK